MRQAPPYSFTLRLAGISLFFVTISLGAADIRGVVLDDHAQPIPGANVYVWAAVPKEGVPTICPNCYVDCGKKRGVDAKGNFLLKGLDPNLRFVLLAVADGYEPAFARGVDATNAASFRLKRRSAADRARLITGSVVDPKGKAVVGAVVEPRGWRFPVQKPDGTQAERVGFGNIRGLDQLSITNAKGEFALRMPEAKGTLDVLVTAPLFAAQVERRLEPGVPKKIEVAEGVAVIGRVLDAGKPVAGVPVAFVQRNRESSQYLGHFEVGTDRDGRFLMTDLTPGIEWVLYVPQTSLDKRVSNPAIFTTGARRARMDAGTLLVTSGRRVQGTVVPPAGKPLPKIVLLSNYLTGEEWRSAVTGDGAFSFAAVPDGELILEPADEGMRLTLTASAPAQGPTGIRIAEKGDFVGLKVFLLPE